MAALIVLLGDSNTWLSGDDCSAEAGWGYWLAAETGATCRSFARSGATWSHTPTTTPNTEEYSEVISDDNVISSQVLRLVESGLTPDLILIMAGTNDAWFTDRRPNAFCGGVGEAVRADCAALQAHFPQARIVLITPPPSVQAGKENIERVSTIITTTAATMGIEVVRADTLEIETSDGTHTTPHGARTLAKFFILHSSFFI